MKAIVTDCPRDKNGYQYRNGSRQSKRNKKNEE